ncbi:Fatty acid synthase beta subunit [Hyphodiscus hymeniophilus]|uniref:Fatty acid synthase beta subunit n=1 Tax=Hyphodiscus hymeniophilus TaxID=353542 RepID=A0A9P6SKZ6_9HELO|nr:Fatty acid synthase beta subunit [Hyphodiscus hymeniophilus]
MDVPPPTKASPNISLSWNFGSLEESERIVLPFLQAFGVDISPTIRHIGGPFLPLEDAPAFLDYLHEVQASPQVLAAVALSFEAEFLSTTDIHSLALRLDVSLRNSLIKAYLQTMGNLGQASTQSALFKAAETGGASILAVFGGQGTHNPDSLSELRNIYRTYQPFLQSLIHVISSLLQRLAQASVLAGHYANYDFDILQWIEHPETAPDAINLATATFSFPINGLISLAHYCIACHVLGLNPGQMRSSLAGTTGHSQGIVVAAAIAASDSWETFTKAAESAIELLFRMGLESHEGSPYSPMSSSFVNPEEQEVTFLSSMLSVRGMEKDSVNCFLDEVNAYLDHCEKAYLALESSRDMMVIAGPTKTLHGICALLRDKRVPEGLDQAKIPFPHRKPYIEYELLPISAPFHSPHLEEAADIVLRQVKNTLFTGLVLGIPVYHTKTGEDIRHTSEYDLTKLLVKMVMLEKVDWKKASLHPGLTHILDFGPSRISSALRESVHGSGIRLIFASEFTTSSERSGGKPEMFAREEPIISPNWCKLYGPKIVMDLDGKRNMSTRMSRILGTPPIMVAGMTPTTVPWDFVSSVTNAGYHIEIAGGGYSQAAEFEAAIHKLALSLPSHRGITCNLIYVSPRALAWQIPLIRRLIIEGVPIHGLTIGAGVPSLDVAGEYIETLGLKHISFKPGSLQAIHEVLHIAESNPSFPIGLQWTGGRAGGHHSYEDFHAPLLKTYELIRRQPNVFLIVGGGFGDAQGIFPYLTGEWSERHGYPRMPVDGVLLGSRLMAAKEAHTSDKVKTLIMQTPGTSESDWHKTYDGPAGGVITISSEMGEPIHKLATRGVVLWKELDTTIFNIKDPIKRLAALRSRQREIVGRLNTDYAKPWFAVDSKANSIELEDMTYLECLQRIAALMYVSDQRRWIHLSYETFFYDFVRRIQERLVPASEIQYSESMGPLEFLETFIRSYPDAQVGFLYPEDVSFFIGLCKRRGQKPVNFIPCLDENFESFFKKDSLWQAEDIDAIVDQDPQRVCIIHGPVAAKYTTTSNEPASVILDSISNDLVDLLCRSIQHDIRSPSKDRKSVQSSSHKPEIVQPLTEIMVYHFHYPILSVEDKRLLQNLLFGNKTWVSACLEGEYVSRDGQRLRNMIRTAFNPADGDIITINCQPGTSNMGSVVLSRPTVLHDTFYPAFSLSSTDGQHIRLELQAPHD